MPAYYPGKLVAGKRRRSPLRRNVYFALDAGTALLRSTELGIRNYLYWFRGSSLSELVFCAPVFILCEGKLTCELEADLKSNRIIYVVAEIKDDIVGYYGLEQINTSKWKLCTWRQAILEPG